MDIHEPEDQQRNDNQPHQRQRHDEQQRKTVQAGSPLPVASPARLLEHRTRRGRHPSTDLTNVVGRRPSPKSNIQEYGEHSATAPRRISVRRVDTGNRTGHSADSKRWALCPGHSRVGVTSSCQLVLSCSREFGICTEETERRGAAVSPVSRCPAAFVDIPLTNRNPSVAATRLPSPRDTPAPTPNPSSICAASSAPNKPLGSHSTMPGHHPSPRRSTRRVRSATTGTLLSAPPATPDGLPTNAPA